MTFLNIEQRAFVVGDEGVCPLCAQQVEWKDIDTNFYVCMDCLEAVMDKEQETSEVDAHIIGYMDGMGDLLRSVLREMVEKGDPALSVVRNVIKEVEKEQDVKL